MITVRFEKTASAEKFIRIATFPDGRSFTGELQLSPDLYLPGAPYQWNIPEHQLSENFLKATGVRLALAALGEDGTAEFIQRKRTEDLYSVPPVLAFYLTASGAKHGMGQAIYNKYSRTIAGVYYAIYREGEKTWLKELARGKGAGRGRGHLDYLVKGVRQAFCQPNVSLQVELLTQLTNSAPGILPVREVLEYALQAEKNIGGSIEGPDFKEQGGGLLHKLGYVFQSLRQWKEALENYEKAILWNEKTSQFHQIGITYHQIGRVYEEQGQWKDASDAYRASLWGFIKYAPESPDVAIVIGSIKQLHDSMVGAGVDIPEGLKEIIEKIIR